MHLRRATRATGPALRDLRRFKRPRQIEIAELMVPANSFTVGCAKCLVATTPVSDWFRMEAIRDWLGRDDVAACFRPLRN